MSDPRGARLLVPVLCFIITTIAVMQTSVVPIVGTIRDQLSVSTTAAGWVLTANLLAAAVTTPLLGRLADLRGKRPVLLTVLAVVLVGSLLCAATDSFALLLLGRVLQGVSFALFPVGIAVLRAELPPQRLIGAMGLFSGTLGVGGAIGMVLTGLMVSGGDYRRVFWLVAAFNVVALLSAFLVVPKRRRAEGGRIDWLGAALLAVGLALVLLALSEGGTWGWAAPPTVASAALGLAVLAGWFLFERHVDEPLVPPRMLTHRPVFVVHGAAFLVGMAMFVSFLATAYFVQTPPAVAGYGFGATVLEATAVYMLPGALVGVVAAALAGRLIHRFDARWVLIGACVLGIAGFALVAVVHDRSWQLIVSGILVTTFVSLAYAALPALLVAEVRPDQTGVANSINSIARTAGSSLSSAVVTTLLATLTVAGTGGVVRESAFVAAFALGAAAAAAAAVLVLVGGQPATRPLSDREEDEVEATALAAEWGSVSGLAATPVVADDQAEAAAARRG
ncbi:MFS transporter [Rhodococcus aetherivorans]|uniref:MFS transporter n=1 Tax=Rhodococcus aetherivorans TaxID=191292 RepID=UPI00045C8382|nr:MFS transporter [Rhodococcus aetherivorans]KDE14294.1 major facilitator transporter [Rhodococcus aetherivorans]MDV6292527.1 MFS transporter [Rhodococcus aetherivorans]